MRRNNVFGENDKQHVEASTLLTKVRKILGCIILLIYELKDVGGQEIFNEFCSYELNYFFKFLDRCQAQCTCIFGCWSWGRGFG